MLLIFLNAFFKKIIRLVLLLFELGSRFEGKKGEGKTSVCKIYSHFSSAKV